MKGPILYRIRNSYFVVASILMLQNGHVTLEWNPNSEIDLAGYKVYYGKASRQYDTVRDVGLNVHYQVQNLTEGIRYYFAVTAYDLANQESNFSEEVSAIIPSVVPLQDRTPPEVDSVQVLNATSIRIAFSEAVEKASAENGDNYKISGDVAVDRAVLSGDSMSVILTTTKHTFGQQYYITISDIQDKAEPPNIIANNSTLTYAFDQDTTPPKINSIQIVNATTLRIRFSEAMVKSVAENTGNYKISGGVRIKKAALSGDALSVILTTTEHAAGQRYTLRISDIRDLANPQNAIAPNSTITYVLDEQLSENAFERVYNYPNPFNPQLEVTHIRFFLQRSEKVTIRIYDSKGDLIRTCLEAAQKGEGEHTEDIWDGTNRDGYIVGNGVYLCKVTIGSEIHILKIAVLRQGNRYSSLILINF